jgi:hypothetical protein
MTSQIVNSPTRGHVPRTFGRSYVFQALALTVLLAATFGFAASDDLLHLARDRDLIAVPVPHGHAGAYLGANWRIEGLRTTTTRGTPPTLSDTALVVHVRIKVDGPFAPGDDWRLCRPALVDESGRRWLPLGLALPVQAQRAAALDGRPGPSCSSALARNGQKPISLSFDEFYLVPPDALASLHATVSTAGGRPHYLKLALNEH